MYTSTCTATHGNTLQHTATHCRHTCAHSFICAHPHILYVNFICFICTHPHILYVHIHTFMHMDIHVLILLYVHIHMHCNTLQHTATHCRHTCAHSFICTHPHAFTSCVWGTHPHAFYVHIHMHSSHTSTCIQASQTSTVFHTKLHSEMQKCIYECVCLFVSARMLVCICTYECICLVVQIHEYIRVFVHMLTARKTSWNPAGVNPVHWIPSVVNPGSLVSGTNRQCTSVRSWCHKSNKRVYTGSNPWIQEASWAVCIGTYCLCIHGCICEFVHINKYTGAHIHVVGVREGLDLRTAFYRVL